MANKLTLYFSVENGGDGSAYPKFFDTEELAEYHQNHLGEGWGESCTGKIVIEGDNLTCPELVCAEGHYLELLLTGWENKEEVEEFKNTFFPHGLPIFTVEIKDDNYYNILVNGRIVYKSFAHPEKKACDKGIERLTKKLDETFKL